MKRNSAVLDTPKFGAPSATTLRHIDHVKKAHLIEAAQHDFNLRMRSLQDAYTKSAAELHEQLLNRVYEIQNGEGWCGSSRA